MADEAPEYTSPKRCPARSFRLSRDRWKAKAAERLAVIRAARVRSRDLTISRDLWKQKALYYEHILRDKGLLPAAQDAAPQPQADLPLPAFLAARSPRRSRPNPPPAQKTGWQTYLRGSWPAAGDANGPRHRAQTSLFTMISSQVCQPRKKEDPPRPLKPDTTGSAACGQHFDLDRIWLCLSCILRAAPPAGVPRLCRVFDAADGPARPARAGLDDQPHVADAGWDWRRLRQPVVEADDWVWMVDHSVQLGRDRLLAVLGGRAGEMPQWRRCAAATCVCCT